MVDSQGNTPIYLLHNLLIHRSCSRELIELVTENKTGFSIRVYVAEIGNSRGVVVGFASETAPDCTHQIYLTF
jgi:hypothetical protein